MALNGGADEAEARRERLDRASRAMGGLLLRGYRMLGSSCPRCGTILLQDKEQRLLCVTCQDPDGPGGGHAPDPHPAPSPAAPRPEHCEGAATAFRGAPPGPPEPPGAGGGGRGGGGPGRGAGEAPVGSPGAAENSVGRGQRSALSPGAGLRRCPGGAASPGPPPRHRRAPPEILRASAIPEPLKKNPLWTLPINAAHGGHPPKMCLVVFIWERLRGFWGGLGTGGIPKMGFKRGLI